MKSLKRILTLIKKEILALFKDPKGRVAILAPPIMQLAIFGFAISLEVKNVSIAVLNHDNGSYSKELLSKFSGATYFKNVYIVNDIKELESKINKQEILAGVVIKEDFSKKIHAQESGEIQLLLDGRNSNASQILGSYIIAISQNLSGEIMQERGFKPSGEVVVRNFFNPNLDYSWFTIPGLIALILTLMGTIITALSIAREREVGTFDQLLVSPLRPFEIILGKTFPSLIVGLLQGTMMLVFGQLIFSVPFAGSLWFLYITMTIYLLSIIGIGLVISTISHTQQQAILGVFVFSVPAILLSGFATPVENMPLWLQNITYINPLRHALNAIYGIYLKDVSFSQLIVYLQPIVIISIVTLSFSIYYFRKKIV